MYVPAHDFLHYQVVFRRFSSCQAAAGPGSSPSLGGATDGFGDPMCRLGKIFTTFPSDVLAPKSVSVWAGGLFDFVGIGIPCYGTVLFAGTPATLTSGPAAGVEGMLQCPVPMKQAYPPGDDSSCHEAMNEAEEHCGKGHRRIGYGKIQLVGAPAQQLKRKDTQGNSREHPADKLIININSLISPDHQRDGDENTVSQSQHNERHQEEFVVFQGVLLWFRHVDLRI
jgi:hypothetical protein